MIPVSITRSPSDFWFGTSMPIPSKITVSVKKPHKSTVNLKESFPDVLETGDTNFHIQYLWELHNYIN